MTKKLNELEEISNGLVNSSHTALWIILYLALGGGLGGGVLTLASTQDRYTMQDAGRDFVIRDERIAALNQQIAALSRVIQKIDDTHPPPKLVMDVDKLKDAVHEIQLEQARRGR